MLRSVTIQGTGIAAACCAKLLLNRKIPISIEKKGRPNLPSLLVSSSTQHLIADVFDDHHLFDDFPVITKRVVLWHNQAPVELPHSGAVMPESIFLERLWSRIDAASTSLSGNSQEPIWRVMSSKNSSGDNTAEFGARRATASAVQLSRLTETSACYVEALESGWLFLLPVAPGSATLISVGSPVHQLLGQSRLVASYVNSVSPPNSSFAAYPRILDPLCGPGWLACGTGAMGFDPICGEGAGNAVREAILLSAALGFIAQRADSEDVLEHYSARLLGGFLKHLYLCRNFYSAGDQEWWRSELYLLEQGIQWAEQKLSTIGRPQFRLSGFDLQRLNPSS